MKLWELEEGKKYKCVIDYNCAATNDNGAYEVNSDSLLRNNSKHSISYTGVKNCVFEEIIPKKKVTLWRHWYFLGTNDIPSFCANMKNWYDIDPKDKIDCKFIKSTIIEEFEY